MSIHNIGRNKWRVVVKKKNPAPGEHPYHDKVFSGTKSEAADYEHKLRGAEPEANKTTLGEWYEIWLPTLSVSPVTKKEREYGVELTRSIHNMKLCDITAFDIERCVHSLKAGSQRLKAKRALNIALKAARKKKLIRYNPMEDADLNIGEGKKRDFIPYTAAELPAVYSAFRGHIAEPVVIAMSFCGLSNEEALALDWEDFDPIDCVVYNSLGEPVVLGSIKITKAWTRNGGAVEKEPKNRHRRRTVYISGWGRERLEELCNGKSGAIWPGKHNKRVGPEYASEVFRKVIESAGINYAPLNHLRHSHTTISLKNNIDLLSVSKGIGHARPSTTSDFYAKLKSDEARMDVALLFSSLVDCSGCKG